MINRIVRRVFQLEKSRLNYHLSNFKRFGAGADPAKPKFFSKKAEDKKPVDEVK
jgi:hypothetical protein